MDERMFKLSPGLDDSQCKHPPEKGTLLAEALEHVCQFRTPGSGADGFPKISTITLGIRIQYCNSG